MKETEAFRFPDIPKYSDQFAGRLPARAASMTIKFPPTNLDIDQLEKLQTLVRELGILFPECDITIEPRRLPEMTEARTHRDKVIDATREQPATVEDIVRATGLDPKRIRGVLTAPDLVFVRETKDGLAAYRYGGTRERKRNKSAKRTAAANGEP